MKKKLVGFSLILVPSFFFVYFARTLFADDNGGGGVAFGFFLLPALPVLIFCVVLGMRSLVRSSGQRNFSLSPWILVVLIALYILIIHILPKLGLFII